MKLFDGFANLLKGFGGRNDTRETTTWEPSLKYTQNKTLLNDLYASSWAGAKLVDIPIDDALREGRKLTDLNGSELKAFEKYYIDLDEKINTALKWARVFGSSAIIVVSRDDDLSKPLNQLRKGDILNFAIMGDDMLSSVTLDRNPLSPTYLQPEYLLVAQTSQQIHKSRYILLDGIDTTIRQKELNGGFGTSIFERVFKNIEDSMQTSSVIRNLIEQSSLDVAKIDGLNEAVGNNQEDLAQKRIEMVSQMKSILNTIALDTNDDYVNITKNFAGLNEIQMGFFQILCAGADIPFTRFMGKSADGMNATGEGDLRNYYDMVKSKIQRQQLRKIYNFTDRLVCMHLFGKDILPDYEFNTLYQKTEKEQLEINKMRAETHQIYLDNSVINEEEVLKELQDNGQYLDYTLEVKESEYYEPEATEQE